MERVRQIICAGYPDELFAQRYRAVFSAGILLEESEIEFAPGEVAMPKYNILILGASYGSLLASKMMFGGHNITLVCLPAEADLINVEGFRVRMPIRGSSEPIEINFRKLPGKVTAACPGEVNPNDFDLIGLAMQEPQYGSSGVRELLDAVARSHVPCMSIMNMPPLPYMKRIAGLDSDALKPRLY